MLYFKESNFRTLPAVTLGIENLRQRLSIVLFDQIKAELPRLIEDIETGISNSRRDLETLGPSRSTIEEQKMFLVDLSDDFQRLCGDAIKGDFEHDFFKNQSQYERRLSSMIANMGMGFKEVIRLKGAQWDIVESPSKMDRKRTRAKAIEEVGKLVKKSRGREVSNSQ